MSSVDSGASRKTRKAGKIKSRPAGDGVIHVAFSRAEAAAPTGSGDEADMQKKNEPGDASRAATPDGATREPEPEAGPSLEPGPVEPAMVDRSMQVQLGKQLRALYDDVSSEPIPDRLLKLLDQLESKETKR